MLLSLSSPNYEAVLNNNTSFTEKNPAEVAEERDDLYVDDLITGGENFEQVASLKDIAM